MYVSLGRAGALKFARRRPTLYNDQAMVANSNRRTTIPFNKDVLQWARKRAGRSYEQAAKKVGVSPSKIEEWEDGRSVPTVRQGRLLAADYERPFLEFFAKSAPTLPETILVPDFRLNRQATLEDDETREIARVQSWAETQRLNLLDLYELLGEQTPRFPTDMAAKTSDNPSDIAYAIRERIGPTIKAQVELRSDQKRLFPSMIRASMEAGGILVLKNTALEEISVRGICIFSQEFPIVVFGGEAPSAQAFTLAHELGHIVLNQSAIIGPPPPETGSSHEQTVERWCNKFAAAYLVPERALALYRRKPSRPEKSIDDYDLSTLATRFAVSRHAMLIRMVELGYVQPSFYWAVKYLNLIEEEKNYQAFGRAPYYGTRYRSALGDLYTGMVLEAWSTGRITNHNAGEFMGIKNLEHLNDIRDHFGT